MANRLLKTVLRDVRLIQKAGASNFHKAKIGNREIVGYGCNGVPNYIDRTDYPMPAIRFRETTPDIQVGADTVAYELN